MPHGPDRYQLGVYSKRGDALRYSPVLAGGFLWPLIVAL